MSWLAITLLVVAASFLAAYGFTEWLARRDPARAPAPRHRSGRRPGSRR